MFSVKAMLLNACQYLPYHCLDEDMCIVWRKEDLISIKTLFTAAS